MHAASWQGAMLQLFCLGRAFVWVGPFLFGSGPLFFAMWLALRMHDIPSLYPTAMLHAVPGAYVAPVDRP